MMFLLRIFVLLALSSPVLCFTGNSFQPSQFTLPSKTKTSTLQQKKENKVKFPAMNKDFRSLFFDKGIESDKIPTINNAQKKIEEATEPLKQAIANLTKKNTQLKSQVRNLNDVITDLKSKKAAQTGECSAAKKKVTSLTANLKKAEERAASVSTTLNTTAAKAKSLKAQLSKKEAEVKKLQRENRELKTKPAEAEENEVKEIKKENHDQKTKPAEAKENEVKEINKENHDQKTKPAEAKENEVMEIKKENHDQKTKPAEAKENEVKEIKKENHDQKTKPAEAKENEVKEIKKENLDQKPEVMTETEEAPETPVKKLVLVDGCPEEFTNKMSICYGIIKDHSASYDSAQAYCKRNYGGRLAVLDTFYKFITVRLILVKMTLDHNVWVGGHEDGQGTMKWTDGKRVKLSFWIKYKKNTGTGKCGALDRTETYRMKYEPCQAENMFVCEVVKGEQN